MGDGSSKSECISLKRGTVVRTLVNQYDMFSTRTVLKPLYGEEGAPAMIDVMRGEL